MIKTLFIIKRERSLLIALSLFLITLPISYGLNTVSTIVIACLFFVDDFKTIKEKSKKLLHNKFFNILLCFFTIQLVGILYSNNLDEAIGNIRTLLPIIVLPMTILTEKLDKRKVLKLIGYFKLYMFFGLTIAFIYQYYRYNTIFTFEHNVFETIDISTFYFSAFIYLAILQSLFALAKSNFRDIKQYLFIIFFSFSLLLLGARISILVLIFCLIFFIFKLFPKTNIANKIIYSVLIVFSVIFGAYQIPQVKKKVDISLKTISFDFETILTKNQISNSRNSIEYRILINYCSLQILKENIMGVGIGDYRDVLNNEYDKINFRAGKTQKYNSHNQYMEEFIKQGVIGGGIFIVLIFFILSRGLIQNSYFFYIGVYIALVCLVESFFYRQHGVMFSAFFLSLFYNLEKLNAQPTTT